MELPGNQIFPLSVQIHDLYPMEAAINPAQIDQSHLRTLLAAQGEALTSLYRRADEVRARETGDQVHVRAIIEFSNYCNRDCRYCGIRASNRAVNRYAMSAGEILALCRALDQQGVGTVVLQSGEAPRWDDDFLAGVIANIKKTTKLAITISAGVRPESEYRRWRDAGMDRYLLRFETSDPGLYASLHPDSTLQERLDALHSLQQLGVQTGSGFLIGVPGETRDSLARNILLCRELDLDMIGSGPFLSHPDTPLAGQPNAWQDDPQMMFRALALLRLTNPRAHIPATTAFDAFFPGTGRNLALQRGANVFMPNATPAQYRESYLLYPGKPGVDQDPAHCAADARRRIQTLGREVASGRGDSVRG